MRTKEAGTCPKCGSTDVYGGDMLDKDLGTMDEEFIVLECQDCNYDFYAYYKFMVSEGEDE